MGTCANSLWQRTRSTIFVANTRARNRPHRAVQCTSRRLIEQARGYAHMERHVPGLLDWVQKNNEAAPEMRCAILGMVFWLPDVLQQLWIDVSVRCPHAVRYNESASKPGVATVAGEAEKTKRYGMAVRALVFETYGRLASCCVIWWLRRRQMDSVARMLSDDGGPSWNECC